MAWLCQCPFHGCQEGQRSEVLPIEEPSRYDIEDADGTETPERAIYHDSIGQLPSTKKNADTWSDLYPYGAIINGISTMRDSDN